jgi:hypothetical protein
MIALFHTGVIRAECPLDHWIIGCNPDGIWGTPDDNDLFVNSWQKYRNSGDDSYTYPYYPLTRAASFITSYPYRLGEPGFDVFQSTHSSESYTYGPWHALAGAHQQDYSLTIQCISLSEGIRIVHKDFPQFTLDAVGKGFSYSELAASRNNNAHLHLSYQADDGTALRWVTLQVVDELADGNTYNPSEPFTLVFNTAPSAGDIVIDGAVDLLDLVSLAYHWQDSNASIDNDYYERADTNRDGVVDLEDYQCLCDHWTGALDPLETCGLMAAYLGPDSMLAQFHGSITALVAADAKEATP